MKNLTFTLLAVLNFLAIYAQNNNQIPATFVPYHQYLKTHNTNMQKGMGNAKTLVDNEISFRHDRWEANQWAVNDSASYKYNTSGLETGNTAYNYVAPNWSNYTNDLYTYDDAGNQLTHIVQNWNGTLNAWVNQSNYIVSYNNAGLPLTETYQTWVGEQGAWQNTYNFIFTYNRNNALIEKIDQAWDSNTNVWINKQRSLQTPASNNLVAVQVVQPWNATSQSWSNYYQMIYTYDNHGNQTSSIEQLWQSNAWVNFYKDSTTYDTRDNVTSEVSQTWNTTHATWNNNFKYTYAYDSSNNLTTYAQYNFDLTNNVWVPFIADSYTYTGANKLSTELQTSWNAATGAYVNAHRNEYTYDANSNLIEFQDYYWSNTGNWVANTTSMYTIDSYNKTTYELDQVFDKTTSTMVNTDQYYFYYPLVNQATAINNVANDLGAVVYPNPATGNDINIKLLLNENTDLTFNTYDAQGRLVNSTMHSGYNGANDMQVNYPSLSSGTYYVQLINRANENISVLKFVKE